MFIVIERSSLQKWVIYLLNNIELKEYESVITHEMDLEIAILTHLKEVIVLAAATA